MNKSRTTVDKALPEGTAHGDDQNQSQGERALAILKFLLESESLSENGAVSITQISKATGIDADEVRWLARATASYGFAILEKTPPGWPIGAPAKQLYIELDARRIGEYAQRMAVSAKVLEGRAGFYGRISKAMKKAAYPEHMYSHGA